MFLGNATKEYLDHRGTKIRVFERDREKGPSNRNSFVDASRGRNRISRGVEVRGSNKKKRFRPSRHEAPKRVSAL